MPHATGPTAWEAAQKPREPGDRPSRNTADALREAAANADCPASEQLPWFVFLRNQRHAGRLPR